MKKSMKTFGMMCAASLALTVACSNGDDSASAGNTRTTYTVGDIVSFEGGRYLVTKNTESAARSAARAATNSDSGLYYQNENAAKYRERQLAELSNGITQYVELFDITTRKDTGSKDTASLDDTYIILQNDVKVWTVRQRWQSTTIFPDTLSKTEKAAEFNKLSEDELRQKYDPDYFDFANHTSEESKKISIQYGFNRNDDGTVNFTSLFRILTSKAYAKMADGSQKSVYKVGDYSDGKLSYQINDPNSSSGGFFFMWLNSDGTFYLSTEGDGKLGGSTAQSDYQNKVTIKKAQYDTDSKTIVIKYKVERTVNNKSEESKDYTLDIDTKKDNPDNTYVRISDKTTEIADYAVPDAITFFAPYQDPAVPLNAYTNIVCVPEVKDGTIVYVPKTDEQYEYDFIAQYAKDFQSLYTK